MGASPGQSFLFPVGDMIRRANRKSNRRQRLVFRSNIGKRAVIGYIQTGYAVNFPVPVGNRSRRIIADPARARVMMQIAERSQTDWRPSEIRHKPYAGGSGYSLDARRHLPNDIPIRFA